MSAVFTLACGFVKGKGFYYYPGVISHLTTTYLDAVTLDILRGFQGVGAAAFLPASVCILLSSINFH